MTEDATARTLARIADALERIAPPPAPPVDLRHHAAYHWDGAQLAAITDFLPPDYALLTGIDRQKAACPRQYGRGSPQACQRTMSSCGAHAAPANPRRSRLASGKVQADGHDIGLVDFASSDLKALPTLLSILRAVDRPFVLFVDDLGFDGEHAGNARALRSILQGGATARGGRVRLYATSNRRHIVSRSMSEQNDPINPRDVVDDQLALADRFGLSLGFHAVDQDIYVAIVEGYAARYGLPFDAADAVQWATQRGSRSGRVAWQYVVELAGREGKTLQD